MEYTRLKDNARPVAVALLVGLALITVLIVFAAHADDATENLVFGSMWVVVGLIPVTIFLRTGNRALGAWTAACFLISASYFLDYKGPWFFVPAGTLILIDIILKIRRRHDWKYRDILELAARSVDHTEDGFTPRPYPLGELAAKPAELRRFGRFLARHLIAFPFHDSDGMYLCVNSSGSPWFKRPAVETDTYVFFPVHGPVAVNVARREYDQFRERLSFDLLCQSLGQLFLDFLGLYREGKEHEILDRVGER